MADSTGLENPHVTAELERALLQRGNAFSFLQAYRTLARRVAEQGGDPEQAIRIRPALSLELPKASIDSIQRIDAVTVDAGSAPSVAASQYEIQTSFLGLYGASSPLPNFYTEDLIAAEQEDEIQARLLLDVFHQRLYRLYAAALQKYQPIYELTEKTHSNFRSLLWSLIGARDEHTRRSMPQPGLFLQYVNLYGRQQKSAAGLHFILADHLRSIFVGAALQSADGVPVNVEQCVEQRLDIPARDRLGLGLGKSLGVNAVLGRYVQDYSSKILIRIGPVSATDYQALMSSTYHWQGLTALIRAYIGPALTCELEISVKAETLSGTRLGDPQWSGMGLTTWLQAAADSGAASATAGDVAPLLRVSRLRLN